VLARHRPDRRDHQHPLAQRRDRGARAGDAGAGFAVVAAEVKTLAGKTRIATDEIARTIDTLGMEAEQVIVEIGKGVKVRDEARNSVARIEDTLVGVGEMVSEVDRQNDQIAQATGAISGHVDKLQQVLATFNAAAQDNEGKLGRAQDRMGDLEEMASVMFDRIVHAGLAPRDMAMVDRTREAAAEATRLALAALADGSLTEATLFDDRYIEVPGPTRSCSATGSPTGPTPSGARCSTRSRLRIRTSSPPCATTATASCRRT
jgi:methyl-accepting chemotaxis protein